MGKKNQHVVPTSDGNWGVRGEGNSRLTRITTTQSEAISVAQDIAKNQNSDAEMAQFAFYAGVGHHATIGMGQARKLLPYTILSGV